jgi:hypothetical protein
MISIKDKKASSEILLMWHLVLWIAAGTIIVIGVVIFYSAEVPIKGQETNALMQRMASCLTDEGTIMEHELNEELLKECGVRGEIIKEGATYIETQIETMQGTVIRTQVLGNKDIGLQCKLKEETEAKEFAECETRKIIGMYKGEETIMKITIGTNYN